MTSGVNMLTLLIYLQNTRRPFEICFENEKTLNKFYFELQANDVQIVRVGNLCFNKSIFKYCLQK